MPMDLIGSNAEKDPRKTWQTGISSIGVDGQLERGHMASP
jgi:hypothetical protein